ncbi:MAG: iron-sulfur cluster assembly accessory protein [Alphaproteobacteria bacterium]|nr:iron-sulfur cluster assembly accessory protein [Alphaproteobacteria bacterium]
MIAPIAPHQELHYIILMNEAFTVSDSAAARITHLLRDEPAGTRLRVAVDGGGCSGFQYKFDFEHAAPAVDDTLFGTANAPVLVDATSLTFLSGSMLDYVERMDASAFEIKNPNAKSSCGCGNSFSVAL